MRLVDPFGRRITYLRLSVTDRCNLRCRYCMPEEGVPKLRHDDVLRYEQMTRIVREAVALGVEKVRVTGGEPLVRKGIVPFLGGLAKTEGLKQLVLTTNGVMLEELAVPLREAGVQRLNVSLDSLRPTTLATITRGGELDRVMAGLEAAERAGFPAPKINAVLMRGVNDDEILDFAELTLTKGYTVRFIEYMPVANNTGWTALCVTGEEILRRISERYEIAPAEADEGSGPAKNYRIAGAKGKIGIITPMSKHFCGSCNRIRVTANGIAKGCLFGNSGVDLKPALEQADDEALRAVLRKLVNGKQGGHGLTMDRPETASFAMSQIGG